MFRWKIITVLLVGGLLAGVSSGYTLTVNSSTGGGSYSRGTVVSIGGLSGSGWYLFVIDANSNVSSGYQVN